MVLGILLLSQMSVFCGDRENNVRMWSSESHYYFRAHSVTGLPEVPGRTLISVSWPREACSETTESFLVCAGEATSQTTHEAPLSVQDLVVTRSEDQFLFSFEADGQAVTLQRSGPCKVRL